METNVRDTRSIGRWLVLATWTTTAVLAAESIASISGLFDLENSPTAEGIAVAAVILAAMPVLALFVTVVIAMRWTYLIANNTYLLSGGETIKPGWAVGWYFVPIASLVKPYQAMREAWQVSRNPADWRDEHTSYLPAWWGLWILWNALSTVSGKLPIDDKLAQEIDLVGALVSIPLAWLFTRLVRDVSQAQSTNRFREVFA